MDKEQLKFNLIRLGVQFDELPNKGESTNFDFVFSLPPNMDWKMAEELLPPDIYKGIRDFHKQHPKGNYIQSTPYFFGGKVVFGLWLVSLLLFSPCNSFASESIVNDCVSICTVLDSSSFNCSLFSFAIELDSHMRYKIAALLRIAIMVLAAIHITLITSILLFILYGCLAHGYKALFGRLSYKQLIAKK